MDWAGLARSCIKRIIGLWLIVLVYSAALFDYLYTLHITETLHRFNLEILMQNVEFCTSTQSGIWGTLNTIAVRQLGIDFQYIQIKSFDNNPTSQLSALLGRDGYSATREVETHKRFKSMSKQSCVLSSEIAQSSWHSFAFLECWIWELEHQIQIGWQKLVFSQTGLSWICCL